MSVKPAGAAFFDQWFEVTMLLERAARRLLVFLFERTDPSRRNGR